MIQNIDLADVVGMIGVVIVIMPFFLLQLGKMNADSMWYQMGNAVGSVLIIISLIYHWNFSSFVIEVSWFVISLIGIFRILLNKRKSL